MEMQKSKNPLFLRKIISGVKADKQNKINTISAALVHHPENDNGYQTFTNKINKTNR